MFVVFRLPSVGNKRRALRALLLFVSQNLKIPTNGLVRLMGLMMNISLLFIVRIKALSVYSSKVPPCHSTVPTPMPLKNQIYIHTGLLTARLVDRC